MYQRIDVFLGISVRLWGSQRIHFNRHAFNADPADDAANGGFEEGSTIPGHEEFDGLECVNDLVRHSCENDRMLIDPTLVRVVLPRNSVLCDTKHRSRMEMINLISNVGRLRVETYL
jgi:hypothetical protein